MGGVGFRSLKVAGMRYLPFITLFGVLLGAGYIGNLGLGGLPGYVGGFVAFVVLGYAWTRFWKIEL